MHPTAIRSVGERHERGARPTLVALDRELSPDVIVRGSSLVGRYRRYPVFSWPWLWRRTLWFGAAVSAFSLFSTVGTALAGAEVRAAWLVGFHAFASLFVITTAGPLLACAVRHRRWPARRERLGLAIAIGIGVALSAGADAWASRYIDSVLATTAKPTAAQPSEVPAPLAVVAFLGALLFYSVLGGGLGLVAYFSEQRRLVESRNAEALARLELQKLESELKLSALQAQVEPHFLFNTLASVRALLREHPERAEATLDALVDYLRSAIPRLRGQDAVALSTLGQQLELCESYLRLMHLRTAGRLRYELDVAAPLKGCAFPPLILLTLVENSVKHGVEPKPGPGRIRIVAEQSAGTLRVSVCDDGLGLQQETGAGVGLANVRAQLRARYGGAADFTLESTEDGGARAEVRVPCDVTSAPEAPPPQTSSTRSSA